MNRHYRGTSNVWVRLFLHNARYRAKKERQEALFCLIALIVVVGMWSLILG